MVEESVEMTQMGAVLKAAAKLTVQAVTTPEPIVTVPTESFPEINGLTPHEETLAAAPVSSVCAKRGCGKIRRRLKSKLLIFNAAPNCSCLNYLKSRFLKIANLKL